MPCIPLGMGEEASSRLKMASVEQIEDAIDNRYGIRLDVMTLPAMLESVVSLRYGLGDDSHKLTYKEIGQSIGVSVERARQLEFDAIRKLRHSINERRMRERHTKFLQAEQGGWDSRLHGVRLGPVGKLYMDWKRGWLSADRAIHRLSTMDGGNKP